MRETVSNVLEVAGTFAFFAGLVIAFGWLAGGLLAAGVVLFAAGFGLGEP